MSRVNEADFILTPSPLSLHIFSDPAGPGRDKIHASGRSPLTGSVHVFIPFGWFRHRVLQAKGHYLERHASSCCAVMSLFKKRDRRNIRKKAVELEDDKDDDTAAIEGEEEVGGEANGQTRPLAGKK